MFDLSNAGEEDFGFGGSIDTADLSSHSSSSSNSDFSLRFELEEPEEDNVAAASLQLHDMWADCKRIEDVSTLEVHTIAPKFDPKEMPKLYVAMLLLMDILEDCTDLHIFDDVMAWAMITFSTTYEGIFNEIRPSMAKSRKPFLKELRRMFRDKVPPEPKNVHVQLPASKNVTTIPTYPFPQCILHLLNDERLDSDDYLQSANNNFDRDTFLPIVPIRNTLRLDELSQVQMALQAHAGQELTTLNESAAQLPSFNGASLVEKRLE